MHIIVLVEGRIFIYLRVGRGKRGAGLLGMEKDEPERNKTARKKNARVKNSSAHFQIKSDK